MDMKKQVHRISGQTVHFFHCHSCNSTQKKIKGLNNNSWVVLWADIQKKGRGRRGRQWESPPGGLYFSFLHPYIGELKAPVQLMGAALVFKKILHTCPGIEDKFAIKWPNDLLYSGRKLAGFLGESAKDRVLLGCGLNVNNTFGPDYSAYRRVPISLKEIGGQEFNRRQILFNWLEKYIEVLLAEEENYFTPRRIAREVDTIGRRVKVGEIEGKAVGLTKSGGLLLSADGEKKEIHAGDPLEVKE